MADLTPTDLSYGKLNESEEAIATVNAFADKHDDPDMQVCCSNSSLKTAFMI